MSRFVALLRGVNVGRAKRVHMAELRKLLEKLGYSAVQTLLNSGNVVFESTGRSTSAHATRIRAALGETLGIEVPVIVKSSKEMAALEAENPLATVATDSSRLLVAFTGDSTGLRTLATLLPLVKEPDQVVLGEQAIYLWCPNGILESRAAKALLGRFAGTATTRNWATVTKITALLRHKAA